MGIYATYWKSEEETSLDMIEKMFEELDSTERLEASLILTRGIKPDTPLDKAPIILNKVYFWRVFAFIS